MFLEKLWGIDDSENIIHRNYTIISSDKTSPLYKRIDCNMSKYVDIVLRECSGKIIDDECVVIDLLKHRCTRGTNEIK